jgi:hypothetical protein
VSGAISFGDEDLSTSGTLTLSGITPTHVLYAGAGGLISGNTCFTFDPLADIYLVSTSLPTPTPTVTNAPYTKVGWFEFNCNSGNFNQYRFGYDVASPARVAFTLSQTTAGKNSLFELYAYDGDASDDVQFRCYGLRSIDVATGVHSVILGWNKKNGYYQLGQSSSGTGTGQRLRIFTNTAGGVSNISQLDLETDGSVDMLTGDVNINGSYSFVCGITENVAYGFDGLYVTKTAGGYTFSSTTGQFEFIGNARFQSGYTLKFFSSANYITSSSGTLLEIIGGGEILLSGFFSSANYITSSSGTLLEIIGGGEILLSGGIRNKISKITPTPSYTLQSNEYAIYVNTTSPGLSVQLVARDDGKMHRIKNHGANSLDITTSGVTIDGASSFTLAPWEVLTIQYSTTETDWMIM